MERAFAGLARTTYIYGVCTVIWALLAAMLASPPDVRKGHFQGWPEPHIYTVYVRYFGHQAAMLTSPPDVWKGHLQGWPEPYIHIFMVFLAGYLAGYLARYFWQGYSTLFVYDHFGNSLIIWPENEYFY